MTQSQFLGKCGLPQKQARSKNLLDELKTSAGSSVEITVKSLFALEVIKEMYKIQFDKLDTSSNEIITHFDQLSKDRKEGKVHT